MKVILTGASSFTGYWFARSLTEAGHAVIAPLHRRLDAYEGVREERVKRVAAICDVVENCPFESDEFLSLVRKAGADLLAQHAAATANYRSAEFDIIEAVTSNTGRLPKLLQVFQEAGGKGVLLTGSVFEQDEGVGNAPIVAFSPYGLSKGLTAQIYRYWCGRQGLPLGKFVIPNPFGPFEEPRFCDYVIRSWLKRETPTVRTPRYVRDNIHVDLLARIYASFAAQVIESRDPLKINPSGYPEAQGAFALRLARELGPRLGVETPIDFAEQAEFPEPAIRINTDIVTDAAARGWNEITAWDGIATYYAERSL